VVVKVEWRPAARESLLEIVDYISDDNPDAAQALKDEIEEKIAGLTENPQMYRPGRVAGTRELVVRSNYIVVYATLADLIVIIQILHAAQQWP
jgi:addiction module RelE/StbE family toxin